MDNICITWITDRVDIFNVLNINFNFIKCGGFSWILGFLSGNTSAQSHQVNSGPQSLFCPQTFFYSFANSPPPPFSPFLTLHFLSLTLSLCLVTWCRIIQVSSPPPHGSIPLSKYNCGPSKLSWAKKKSRFWPKWWIGNEKSPGLLNIFLQKGSL